jgi:hypothetical protein
VHRTLLFLILCIAVAVVPPLTARRGAPSDVAAFPGWPAQLEEKPLASVPLTEKDLRFLEDFPGRAGKFTDGESEILIRWVPRATRKLHPSADCFRGLGYSVKPLPAAEDGLGRRWGRFEAVRGGERLEVRERVFDESGGSWSDVSAWYWSAAFGRSRGPWWAVTVARKE